MDIIDKFTGFLHRKDLRATPERMIIAREIFLTDTHFNAEDLYIHLHNKNHKISRATIYRTLELLVNSGLIRRTVFDHHTTSFEKYLDKKDHGHFICTQCGKIIEFFDQRLELIHQALEKKYTVTINNHTHQIYGKCKDCTG